MRNYTKNEQMVCELLGGDHRKYEILDRYVRENRLVEHPVEEGVLLKIGEVEVLDSILMGWDIAHECSCGARSWASMEDCYHCGAPIY